MKRAPHNTMIGEGEERTKGVEVEKAPKSFYYPQLQVTVEADTQEEADKKMEKIISEREQESQE